MPAVALTDSNGLYAAVSFLQAAKKAHPTHRRVGLDSNGIMEQVLPSFRAQRDRFLSARLLRREISLFLLATRHSSLDCAPRDDMEGYSNLCQLVTLRHLAQQIVHKT